MNTVRLFFAGEGLSFVGYSTFTVYGMALYQVLEDWLTLLKFNIINCFIAELAIAGALAVACFVCCLDFFLGLMLRRKRCKGSAYYLILARKLNGRNCCGCSTKLILMLL
jgi:hypothetical protein